MRRDAPALIKRATGSSSLTSDQRERCLAQRLTAQPQEMFGATHLRCAEGDATRESELPLAESSRPADWD
jgi:hypothetical protein